MNRFAKAWLALTGKLEPEVREVEVPVFGDAVEVNLYQALDPRQHYCFGMNVADWHGTLFHSCAQALSECPGAVVSEVKRWRIADKHYESPRLALVDVRPKPKREKGKRGR